MENDQKTPRKYKHKALKPPRYPYTLPSGIITLEQQMQDALERIIEHLPVSTDLKPLVADMAMACAEVAVSNGAK